MSDLKPTLQLTATRVKDPTDMPTGEKIKNQVFTKIN
jgi:hypothetical protein